MRFLTNLCSLTFIYFFFITIAYAENSLDFQINGIEEKLRKNVQLKLNNVKKSYGDDWSKDNIARFYDHAPQKIKKALEPYGYFKATIKSNLTHSDSKWIASFDISLGTPLSIKKIDLKLLGEGNSNSKLQRFIHHFPIVPGDIFESEKYENAKLELFKIANNEGYIKSFFEKKEIRIDLSKNEVVIILYFQTGSRYYFGQTIFEDSKYNKKFLRRFVNLKNNEPFSSQKLLNLQEDLSSSYYFQQVDVTPDFDHIENHEVPLRLTLLPPKSQRYNIGIGYGSYTGPRITARTEFKRVTDTGQHFDAQLRFSPVLSGVGAKYYIPGKNPLTDQWTIGTNYLNFNPKNGRSISQTFTTDYITKIKNADLSAGLNYLIERFKVENTPKKTSSLLYPKINLSYAKADDLINPNRGISYNFFLQGASQKILSSTNFIQADLKAKYLMSPTPYSKLILRGELGYTIVHQLDDLPLSMRFFAGGLNSIRGYGDSEIGPGRYLEVGSIEFRHKIINNFSAALFYDIGTASDKFGGPFFKGEGAGLIYQSILGPIKLYVARAMDKPNKPLGVEFTIGPEF
jgi:translocation and assembly module TamA